MLVYIPFVMAFLSDTGAYFVGVTCGKHKMAPVISPKKSWEGFLGGLALSLAVSLTFYHFNGGDLKRYIILAVLLGISSFFGDITESGLKRVCKVKDSGNWIPGMGGAFDVLDSFIYVGIVCSLLMVYPGF